MKGEKSTKQGGQAKGATKGSAKASTTAGAKASGVNQAVTTGKAAAQSRSKRPQSKKKSTRKKVSAASTRSVKSSGSIKNAQNQTAAPETQQENNRPGNGLAWVAILASVLALGLSGYAAYQSTLSQALNKTQLVALDERLSFLGTEQKGMVSGVSALEQKSASGDDTQLVMIRALEQSQAILQTTVAGIELASKASTEDIKANLGKNVARWKLDEVHSLLSRVNQYYQLTGDKQRAEAGLNLANATLATIDNPHLASVKAALAEDLLRIQSDVNVDTAAINSRLLALSALIPDLKLLGESLKAVDSVESSPDSGDQADSGLLEAGKSLLGDLGGLVKYKNLDAPLRPSLDGGERFVLYELLQLKVQTAMVALMRHNNAVFQSQLKLAEDEINTFFELEQASICVHADD